MIPLYLLEDVQFQYILGNQTVPALKDINCSIQYGDFVCMSGPSGSGKSTFLNLLGLIEPPQSGNIHFSGRNLKELKESDLNTIRKFEIGFVFQNFHLFPVFTAEENVEYFLTRQGIRLDERNERVKKALKAVGLWEHRKKRPLEMSGGQKQRVAIARALAKNPRVIIADEPTASLDRKTALEIMNLFSAANTILGTTILISSHDPMVQDMCPIRFEMVDGYLKGQENNPDAGWHHPTRTPSAPPAFPPSPSLEDTSEPFNLPDSQAPGKPPTPRRDA
jgi:putative ABC transport system ATP-binding protein